MATTGTITQVIGSTFDAQFPEDQLPEIYNALRIEAGTPSGPMRLTGEVQQHLGGGRVRAVALGSTDGLRRGMACQDTGSAVTVPVGEQVLGRVFNLMLGRIENALAALLAPLIDEPGVAAEIESVRLPAAPAWGQPPKGRPPSPTVPARAPVGKRPGPPGWRCWI